MPTNNNTTTNNSLYYRTVNDTITNINNETINLSTSNSGNGFETYPANIGLYYIIKTFRSNEIISNSILDTPKLFNTFYLNPQTLGLTMHYSFSFSSYNGINLKDDVINTYNAVLSSSGLISQTNNPLNNKSTLNISNGNFMTINNSYTPPTNGITFSIWVKSNQSLNNSKIIYLSQNLNIL